MITVAITLAYGCILVAFALSLVRTVVGPSVPDRILGLDTLSINAVALLTVYGIHQQTDVFFEAALLIAMLGFIGTVSLSKHASGTGVIQ